jgi:RNA recognition motif-containing protein
MNIFVAKLHSDTSSDTLREVFEQFGEVDSAKVIMDRETGRSRGFGFVEMSNDDEGNEAIKELNESELDGRTIVVKQAEDKASRGGSGGGGGFNKFGGGNRGGSGGGNRYDAPRRREY